MSTPYAYHLYHRPTDKHYYGIKHGRDADPTEFWTKYFSSSKLVHQLISEYGTDSFDVEIRKTFSSSQAALLWEHRVLTKLNAAARDNWLNRHNGGRKFRAPITHSPETRQLLSRKLRGKSKSEAWKQAMSISSLRDRQRRREQGWKMPVASVQQALETRDHRIKSGTINPYSEERNAKMSASKRGTKRQYLPDGSFIMVKPQVDQ